MRARTPRLFRRAARAKRDTRATRAIPFCWGLLLAITATSLLLAQYRTNPQAGAGAGAGGQVNPQVNTALYGGGVSASVRYASVGSTSRAMDSEIRYASWAFGALPSDIRYGRASLGPLHPSGPMAYVPPPGPSYIPKPSTAPPSAAGSAAFSTGSIRYVPPAPGITPITSTYVAPRSVGSQSVSPALVTGGPINKGPINTGAIRFAR